MRSHRSVRTAEQRWKKSRDSMEERDYYIEEAKNEKILFKGTKIEYEEWCDEHMKEYADKILIIRKGQMR